MATPIDILIRARDEFTATFNKANAEIDALVKSNVALGTATGKVTSESGKAAGALNDAAAGAKRTHQSFLEANESARALGEQIGVHLPRYVSNFLARSSLIGPVLESAFSGLAVIGLIQVIGELPEAFHKLEGAITGWGEKEQKVYEKFIEDNKKAIERVNDLAVALARINAGDIAATKLAIAQKQDELASLSTRAAAARTEAFNLIRNSGTGQFRNAEGLTAGDLTERAEKLEAEANAVAELIRKLQATATEQTAEATVKASEDFERLSDQLKQVRDDKKKFFDKALEDFRLRSSEGGPDVAAGLKENERLAKLYIDRWKEVVKLEDEGGDALQKNKETWDKLLEDFRIKGSADEIKAGEQAADIRVKQITKAFDEAKKKGQELIKSITDDIGKAFIESLAHVNHFWDAFKRLGLDAVGAITNALLKGLVTRGLQSIIGSIAPSSGLGKLFGLGGLAIPSAAASVAPSAFATIGTSTLLNTGFVANTAVPAPAAFGGGLSGAFGLNGGAGLFGLGSATIPVIGAAIAGVAFLSTLFGHHTHEAPFSRDPNDQRERTYFFYAANELADATRDLAGATKQLKGVNPNDVIVKGLPGALQQSNQFRRDINGVLQDDN